MDSQLSECSGPRHILARVNANHSTFSSFPWVSICSLPLLCRFEPPPHTQRGVGISFLCLLYCHWKQLTAASSAGERLFPSRSNSVLTTHAVAGPKRFGFMLNQGGFELLPGSPGMILGASLPAFPLVLTPTQSPCLAGPSLNLHFSIWPHRWVHLFSWSYSLIIYPLFFFYAIWLIGRLLKLIYPRGISPGFWNKIILGPVLCLGNRCHCPSLKALSMCLDRSPLSGSSLYDVCMFIVPPDLVWL